MRSFKADMQKLLERRAFLITQMKELRDRLAELDLTIALLRGEAEPGSTPPTETADAPARRRKNVKRTVMTLVDEAGTLGVTSDDIVERARERGYDFDRASVSSLLSKFKGAGALVFDGERYYPAGKTPKEPELPTLRVVKPAMEA